MTPAPLSNYPRPDVPPGGGPFRPWPLDLTVAVLGLVEIVPFAGRELPALGSRDDATGRVVVLVVFAAFLALVVAVQSLIVFRKRWGLWLILLLTTASLGYEASQGFAEFRRGGWETFGTVVDLLTFVYLPLRLFGVLGPPPR